MAALLFYEEPVALDRQKHQTLRLKRQDNLDFARDANAVPVSGPEFFEASRDFPVVFSRDKDENFVPLILLSLREKGHPLGRTWDDVYMPMFVRRYPFAMSGEGTIIIDEKAPHLQESDDGDRLFDEEGKNTEVLDTIVRFLGYVDQCIKLTQEFSKTCQEKDLFKPFDAKVQIEEGKPISLGSFYVLDEKKINELSDEDAVTWYKKGWLAWAYAHQHSLSALHRLVKRERNAGKAAAGGNGAG